MRDEHKYAARTVAGAELIIEKLGIDDLREKLAVLVVAVAHDGEVMAREHSLGEEVATLREVERAKLDVTDSFIANIESIPEDKHEIAREVTRAIGRIYSMA